MPGSDPQAMTAMARRLHLDIIQLHGDPLAADVLSLRSCWEGEIWAVVRGGDIWNVDEVRFGGRRRKKERDGGDLPSSLGLLGPPGDETITHTGASACMERRSPP
jgi:hypothetical protein